MKNTKMNRKDFVNFCKENKIERFCFINVDGKKIVSHEQLTEFSDFIFNSPDYSGHEAVFGAIYNDMESVFVAAIHSTVLGPSEGGTRLRNDYETMEDVFTDVLRLSEGMTWKNAVIGIPFGGGKSIIYCPADVVKMGSDNPERIRLFQFFGQFIASLNGIYTCAEDMNTNPLDMRNILTECRFVSCLPEGVGGAKNPSKATSYGIFSTIKGIAKFENKKLKNCRIAIRGAGNVGGRLAGYLLGAGASVIIFDPNKSISDIAVFIKDVVAEFDQSKIQIVTSLEELYKLNFDYYSPNAAGKSIDDECVNKIKCRYICGAENKQLDGLNLVQKLKNRGITYVPDFAVNGLGIANCTMERIGYHEPTIMKLAEEAENKIINALTNAKSENITLQEYFTKVVEQKLIQNISPNREHFLKIYRSFIQDQEIWKNRNFTRPRYSLNQNHASH